jgi:hypothetical protein
MDLVDTIDCELSHEDAANTTPLGDDRCDLDR